MVCLCLPFGPRSSIYRRTKRLALPPSRRTGLSVFRQGKSRRRRRARVKVDAALRAARPNKPRRSPRPRKRFAKRRLLQLTASSQSTGWRRRHHRRIGGGIDFLLSLSRQNIARNVRIARPMIRWRSSPCRRLRETESRISGSNTVFDNERPKHTLWKDLQL